MEQQGYPRFTLEEIRLTEKRLREVTKRRSRNKAAARRYRDRELDSGFVRRKILGRYWYVCLLCDWRVLVQLGREPVNQHTRVCRTLPADHLPVPSLLPTEKPCT